MPYLSGIYLILYYLDGVEVLDETSDATACVVVVFVGVFLQTLREVQGVVDTTSLFASIRRRVMLNANQTPAYADLRMADHDGGISSLPAAEECPPSQSLKPLRPHPHTTCVSPAQDPWRF